MLLRAVIRNFAIIENIEIQFDKGLNIITGETGAGKSIVLGALGMVLGNKADMQLLRNKDEKAVVEAAFDIEQYQLNDFFAQNDIDYNAETIVRREIQPNGKSRAFVNDTPVTLNVLKSFTEKLIDIHAQQDTQMINVQDFHLSVLDAVCNHDTELQVFKEKYKHYILLKKRLESLAAEQQQWLKEFDFIQFQFKELDEIQLENIDENALETELQSNENAESILQTLQQLEASLTEEEFSAQNLLNTMVSSLKQVEKFRPELLEYKTRLQNISIEIKDINRDASRLKDNITYNPETIDEIQQKLKQLHHLYKKHGVQQVEDLQKIHAEMQAQINKTNFSSTEIQALENEMNTCETALKKQAKLLHENRQNHIEKLQNAINTNVRQLGMEHAQFVCHLQEQNLHENGISKVEFYFSANKGNTPQPLKDVASGGEKSRLMLVIKSILAQTQALPTIIFDEIDAGISGEVAQKMGKMIQHLSEKMQIIIITHLPQIASLQGLHYFVYKDDSLQRTQTFIKQLSAKERIHHIAQMLSGANPTEAAIINAKELLKL